ncbi:hypothetical protein QFC22_000754 [Naganishia vaughanmartiniae]|uniref:Uncharacterized protein n=1 Tax=Naganishia vaughanmartiniae TaxID=1424756 RepID=A0ACC2XK04_9TREE|nr:hypothetical protein QFC22_000754 [Naganishia vaughanmartiniae]
MPFRVAILTVSDTTYNKGAEYDLSGPLLAKNVEQQEDYELADTAVVPDDLEAIQSKVAEWVARKGGDKVDWIITTGGHLSPHITSSGTTPAMTSVLIHGLKQLQGGTGDDVHPPRESVRQGNVNATTVSSGLNKEALAIVDSQSKPLPTETIKTGHALKNYVLAENVFATNDLPSTRTTNVDGYAVVAAEYNRAAQSSADDTGLTVRVVRAKSASGEQGSQVCVYRINTGGPLPTGTDSVIMVEDTELVSSTDEGHELEIKVMLREVPFGDNVRQPGSDAKRGEQVLDKGTVIGSGGGEVGLLGFVGKREVLVHRRPRVAILSTGNELVELESATNPSSASDTWTGVVDTNRPSLRSTLEGLGYDVVDLGIAPDTWVLYDLEMDLQEQAMRKGMAEADIILTTGGTSMGEADLLKPLIEHRLGGTIHFGRVAMKPGKPTTFATVPASQDDATSKLVFALPGNPASALVTFYLFVIPALRGLGGWPKERRHLPRVGVQVDCDMKLDPREEFHRVVVSASSQTPGMLVATTTGGQRSSRVASLCGANGLVHLPSQQKGGVDRIKKGQLAQAVLIGEIRP